MAESFENLADWENEDLEKSLAEAVDSYDKQEEEKKKHVSMLKTTWQNYLSSRSRNLKQKGFFSVYFKSLLHEKNRFHVAVRLFSNRSQRTSKCGKNISDTLGCASCATFLFLPHFDVICDLLLNRSTAIWNLVVKWIYPLWYISIFSLATTYSFQGQPDGVNSFRLILLWTTRQIVKKKFKKH